MKYTLDVKIDQLTDRINYLIDLLEHDPQRTRFLSVREAAKSFGCCEQTIRDGINLGKIPAHKNGRHYEIPYQFVIKQLGEDPISDNHKIHTNNIKPHKHD